jgi:hypothetical protein
MIKKSLKLPWPHENQLVVLTNHKRVGSDVKTTAKTSTGNDVTAIGHHHLQDRK